MTQSSEFPRVRQAENVSLRCAIRCSAQFNQNTFGPIMSGFASVFLKLRRGGYRGGKYLFILQFISLKHAHWGLTKYLTMGANQLFPVALRRDRKSVIPGARLTGEGGSSIFCQHVCQRQQNVLINANGLCVCLCVSACVYATHQKGVSPSPPLSVKGN